jgi:hypothetical protein
MTPKKTLKKTINNMKKPFPPKKTTGKKVFEYGGLEKYASKSAMMKHEKAEPKSKEMAEGKSYKVGTKTTSRDSMSSTNSMDPKKKPTSSMSKPPKKEFGFGKTMKKATGLLKKVAKGPKKTGLNRYM